MKHCLSKRTAIVFLVLICAVMITGCTEETICGEVTGVKTDAQTGVFSFVLTQDDGEPVTVVTDQDTHIFSWLDEVSESDFRAGAMEGIFVSVAGRVSNSNMKAMEVQIDGLRMRDVYTLEDGVQIDLMIGPSHSIFCLEDGTELLMVQNTIGPDNVYSGTGESLDALSQEAQQKIKEYFDAQGILYDIYETLENAYDAYYILKDDYTACMLSQEMAPTASNDEVIYYITVVTTPDDGTYGHAELRLGAAFNKETGQAISASELFTCEPDALIERFAEICKVDDEALIAEMKANFKLEYVVFFPNGIEITFPAEALPEYGISFGMGFDYSQEVRALLQPWAVPKDSGLE